MSPSHGQWHPTMLVSYWVPQVTTLSAPVLRLTWPKGHDLQAPSQHGSLQEECLIGTSTIGQVRNISTPYSVCGPPTCGDTRLLHSLSHIYPLSASLYKRMAHLTPCVLGVVEILTPCPNLKSIMSFWLSSRRKHDFSRVDMVFFKIIFVVSKNRVYCWNPHPFNVGGFVLKSSFWPKQNFSNNSLYIPTRGLLMSKTWLIA